MSRDMKDTSIKWVGKVPNTWRVYPAKTVFSEIRKKNKDGNVTNSLKFYNGSIIRKTNFDADSDDYVAETITNYTVVEPNTIMINGLNLNYDLKSLRVGLVNELGVITSAYLALKPDKEQILPLYANYLLKAYETKMAFHNMGAGIRKTLGFKEFKNQPILLPSLIEQDRIARFLERKCATIDSVIKKTANSIDEYNLLKKSLIITTITKGIRSSRKLVDSGVDWMGAVPDSWKILSLKYLCSMQSGKNLVSEQIGEEGVYPVYGGNGKRGYYDDYNCDGKKLLVGRQGALCGNVHRVEGKFWATEHAVVTENKDSCIIDYLYYLLIGMDLNQYASSTAAQPGLAVSTIQNIRTCLPPLDEQAEIAEYLDREIAKVDALIVMKEKLIDELDEYKKSLIFEYATGKKEVPYCY